MKKVFIYTLAHPISNEIRYVGKTTNLTKRLYAHINTRYKTPCSDWCKTIKKNNLLPLIEVLDIVDIDQWEIAEIYWISQFKTWGFDLLNLEPGGFNKSKFTKEKLSKSRKGKSLSLSHKNNVVKAENYKKRTKETFDKISKKLQGIKFSTERLKNMTEASYNNSKLNKSLVNEIFNMKNKTQKEIAEQYGINQSDVSNIKNKKRFKNWIEQNVEFV